MTTATEPAPVPAPLDGERLLTAAELGTLFRVTARTAARWGADGAYGGFKTHGGRVRFREAAVRQAIGSLPGAAAPGAGPSTSTVPAAERQDLS